MKLHNIFPSILLLTVSFSACQPRSNANPKHVIEHSTSTASSIPNTASALGNRIAQAAESIVDNSIVYDPTYFVIAYPNGDVPKGKGVCTDVVIRTFRVLGIDLQKNVHEDMASHFAAYPKIWGRSSPDKNIDHRRVPNLMTYFTRKGYAKTITNQSTDYMPGDVVAWRLQGGQTHIGVVSNQTNKEGTRYLMVHNIGSGQVLEDCLFDFTIIGHYSM